MNGISGAEAERLGMEQMRDSLQGSRQLEFGLSGKPASYGFLERVLAAGHYGLGGAEGGVGRGYLAQPSGLKRAQTTRRIGRWAQTRPGSAIGAAQAPAQMAASPPTGGWSLSNLASMLRPNLFP